MMVAMAIGVWVYSPLGVEIWVLGLGFGVAAAMDMGISSLLLLFLPPSRTPLPLARVGARERETRKGHRKKWSWPECGPSVEEGARDGDGVGLLPKTPDL
ncbi:hypothetical protein L1049_009074 [Liquidambar formosana]|uniref:Uncharacterized protein n=1 Tax=Liquidambar formosana TaxID=63359 RepID=A0AAP0S4L2_LIQFO